MKYLKLILPALILLVITSCTDDTNNSVDNYDFSGMYEGKFLCVGPMESENGELTSIRIEKTLIENEYIIDFGDEVIFDGIQRENVLYIENQTIGEERGFDVIRMDSEFSFVEDRILFAANLQVDDEVESDCAFELIKL